MSTKPPPASRSGIQQRSDGTSVIPASTRPDGSVRKEIRVKAGYRPPEDVEVYKNRTAAAWKDRAEKGGVPGAEAVVSTDAGAAGEGAAAAANKNAKRREARKRAAAAAAASGEGEKAPEPAPAAETAEVAVDPQAEKAKEARKLAKKLRQARELKDKKEGGNSLLPEQIAKVIKINELLRQLEQLGFDENGEEKEKKKAED